MSRIEQEQKLKSQSIKRLLNDKNAQWDVPIIITTFICSLLFILYMILMINFKRILFFAEFL